MSEKKTKKSSYIIPLILIAIFVIFLGIVSKKRNIIDVDPIEPATDSLKISNSDNYTLSKVVVLSRHNIRSPLSGRGSILSSITPHDWFDWSSNPSELSLRGGDLETMMGQYFRKYLVSKGFMDENWIPTSEEVRLYANSMQRTIATTEYFSSGMFPIGDIDVEYHEEVNTMDPVFNPCLTLVNDNFRKLAISEINEHGGEKGIEGICEKLSDNYDVLKEVLDYKDSDYYKENGDFRFDDTEIVLELGDEPRIKGTLSIAISAADALTLQYYEEADQRKAAFGDTISNDDWTKIAEIADVGIDVAMAYSKAIAVNVANPLLKEMKSELENDNRKFTFLCGHDSNIASVLSALNVDEYYLPNAISRKTPIGGKVVIEKWIKDDEAYATVSLVYQNTKQLRERPLLDLDNPPEKYYLSFSDLKTNEDGYYRYDDLISLFARAINAYDELPKN